MDASLLNSIYISSIILKMGIPIQYHSIAQHILKRIIKDADKSHNIIDDLSLKFPMSGKFNVSKFDEDHIIMDNKDNDIYYFYNKGEDVLYIIDTDKRLSKIIYNSIFDKKIDAAIKKQIIHQLLLHLFRIDISISKCNLDSEIYDIIYETKFITYYYRLKINEEGYYSFSIIKKEEKQNGITEICSKIM